MSSLTLLPLSDAELKLGRESITEELISDGLTRDEAYLKIESDFNAWLDSTDKTEFPCSLVKVLEHAGWYLHLEEPREQTVGALYALMINTLCAHRRVSRRSAAITLSYLPLILRLATEFQLSAAGVAKVLNESDRRVLLHWKGINKIFSLLRLSSTLKPSEVQNLIDEDKAQTILLFKDADLQTIVEILCYESAAFELGDEFELALRQSISPRNEHAFIPYLQTLYYLCTITEFYDHPLEYLYNFKPRGNVANMIFGIFPAEMAAAGNPILNNFKAIDRLSYDWSSSRDDHPTQANALVTLILGLSSLSFSSRRYLAQKIRCASLRYIEVMCPAKLEAPYVEEIAQIRQFLDQVAKCETKTCGVLEQRVTDLLSAVVHGGGSWRTRGLGDPVNATNTASRKLGDSDFQNTTLFQCEAIEAHAGRLTPIYVNEHLRTLRRNLPTRLIEWDNIAELNEWKLSILFVVHEDACGDNLPEFETEVECVLEVVTFQQYIELVFSESVFDEKLIIEMFNLYVIEITNSRNMPYKVKLKVHELLKMCSGNEGLKT